VLTPIGFTSSMSGLVRHSLFFLDFEAPRRYGVIGFRANQAEVHSSCFVPLASIPHASVLGRHSVILTSLAHLSFSAEALLPFTPLLEFYFFRLKIDSSDVGLASSFPSYLEFLFQRASAAGLLLAIFRRRESWAQPEPLWFSVPRIRKNRPLFTYYPVFLFSTCSLSFLFASEFFTRVSKTRHRGRVLCASGFLA